MHVATSVQYLASYMVVFYWQQLLLREQDWCDNNAAANK